MTSKTGTMQFEYFNQFTDSDFFAGNRMVDLESEIYKLDAGLAIRIGGPRLWEPGLHPEFRAVAGFRYSPELAASFNPEKRAKAVLVDMTTGTVDFIDFPASGKSLSRSLPPSPPAETECFRKNILLPAFRFAGPWGNWRLFVYAGSAISNPLDFETGHRELTEKDRRIPPHLLRAPTEQELSSQVFAQRPASPQLNAPGIAFAQEAGEATVDARRWMHPLDLTVFVPDNLPPQQRWIPVRLLFGSDVNWANHSMEILIPKDRTTKVEGGLVGHYTLDLAPLLIDSTTGQTVQPNEWYLTAICKGAFAGPQALTIPVR